jgi:hypothetical protein
MSTMVQDSWLTPLRLPFVLRALWVWDTERSGLILDISAVVRFSRTDVRVYCWFAMSLLDATSDSCCWSPWFPFHVCPARRLLMIHALHPLCLPL